ncbi:MAG: DNA polymerase III subunit alpha, partial [Spirochaetales bacterium]|nr:DNA polymerase III subunit alpha [Spirochaetales bacterium]
MSSDQSIDFVHLHNHTEYSLLDGMISINAKNKNNIAEYAKSMGMNAVAITDHGNMFGAIEFYQCCEKAGVKPIIGSEFYVAPGSRFDHNDPKENCHLILLAKNEAGYNNLIQLSSASFSDGFYYKPRIDKELLRQYSSDLVCLSACIAGSVPRLIIEDKMKEAIEEAMFFKETFGPQSYFFELQYHKLPEEKKCVNALLKMSKELKIPLVATNDCHYLRREDAEIQDVMVCISTKKKITDQDRFKFKNNEFYFKSAAEMAKLFKDVPKAISNTRFVAEMCDVKLNLPGPVLPKFPVPEEALDIHDISAKCLEKKEAQSQPDYKGKILSDEEIDRLSREELYLRKLTREGIIRRYGEHPSDEVWERMNDELKTICWMQFPGYFLIVWDYIKYARDHGIWVGPGRGSGAGSIVAYALGITNIDPLKYDLLFERFLNPDRISMPDFDVDFCMERRGEVLEYVNQKYGVDHVSRIVTFGKMKAKLAVKDAGRVLDVPLETVKEISDMIPDEGKTIAEKMNSPEGRELKAIYDGDNEENRNLIRVAMGLEGLARQTGIHACGVVIGKEPITNYAPKMVVKDVKEGDTVVTQYPGPQLEECGLVKMDFLGLITLTMQRNCLALIKKTEGKDIDLDHLDLEDQFVYKKVFASGDTMAVFQFESAGMQKYLKELKPTCLSDLVAMNALYRPGPLEYIPQFVARKNGQEPIEYDHPLMERYLKDTYGVTVYQEQVMLLSRLLAGFTRGESDSLRKAMGKKLKDKMDALKVKFIDGCMNNPEFIKGCEQSKIKDPHQLIEKIWSDWEAFAKYAFNKSHAVCYAFVAYQCGWLKAYYPVHNMAAALTAEIDPPDKMQIYISYCFEHNIRIVKPNVNYSDSFFTVNDNSIVFPLNAIKGVGDIAAHNIVEVRNVQGNFTDFVQFLRSVDLHVVNRGVVEALIFSGALDDLFPSRKWMIEHLDEYYHEAQIYQTDKKNGQSLLFDAYEDEKEEQTPPNPEDLDEYDYNTKLDFEKERVGFYISGHPLDPYKSVIRENATFNTKSLHSLDAENVPADDQQKFRYGSKVKVAGIVRSRQMMVDKSGKSWCKMKLEDKYGAVDVLVFAKNYETLLNEGKIPEAGEIVL